MTNAQVALMAATQGNYQRDAVKRAAIYKEWLDEQDRPTKEPFERCVYALQDGSTEKPSQCHLARHHDTMCQTEDGRLFHGGPFYGR